MTGALLQIISKTVLIWQNSLASAYYMGEQEIIMLITPYIRILDSDWLIAVIFFFTNSGLASWICRIFTSCRCICIRFNFFFMVFAKSYLPFIPFTETLVTKFVKRYQLCVLCNNRICRFYPISTQSCRSLHSIQSLSTPKK